MKMNKAQRRNDFILNQLEKQARACASKLAKDPELSAQAQRPLIDVLTRAFIYGASAALAAEDGKAEVIKP